LNIDKPPQYPISSDFKALFSCLPKEMVEQVFNDPECMKILAEYIMLVRSIKAINQELDNLRKDPTQHLAIYIEAKVHLKNTLVTEIEFLTRRWDKAVRKTCKVSKKEFRQNENLYFLINVFLHIKKVLLGIEVPINSTEEVEDEP